MGYSEQIEFKNHNIYPKKSIVLSAMGISEEDEIPEEVEYLYSKSIELFKKLITPKGIYRSITITDFEQIYPGEGQNDPVTPLSKIYPKAEHLALYIFTLGKEVSNHINQFIKDKDFPIGFMLDRIASESADKASGLIEKFFTERSQKNNKNEVDIKTLLYSPGYCGWHISSQKKIFEYLNPEQIGITHNESFLMAPIKSVSGIMVTGEKGIHRFKNNFNFCRDCTTFTCMERMIK